LLLLSPFEGRKDDSEGRPKDLLVVVGLVALVERRGRVRLGRWVVVIVRGCSFW
jgi:hypothetical protein